MTTNYQFELPHSEESERHVIGLSILDKQIPFAAKDLATTEFYESKYKAVWRAFLELDADGREIEPISAFDILKRDNPALAESFTVAEITNTTFGLAPHFNPVLMVEKIKNCAARRELMRELSKQINALAVSDSEEVISDLKDKLERSDVAVTRKNSFQPLAEIIEKEVKPALADLRHGVSRRISTGFEAIDRVIGGGLSLSDVLLVAALTGSGKSAFVLQLAFNISNQGIPVAFLSGEMSNRENVLRLLSQMTKTFNLNAETHLHSDQYDFYLEYADALKSLPLFFDSKSYDLQTVGRNIRKLVKNHSIQVLVIDYIQLLKLNRFDKQTRFERISECSQEVKRIAMELGIAVIEVAQFNREGAKSGKPRLHDLDGASQLEKDISLCFIIDREENSNEITLRIEKGRNTGKCEVPGTFTGMNLNFSF